MATKLNVNGKLVQRPGVYAFIQSGIQNPPLTTSYGNICIIDDGIGAGWGGGSGVNGELKQGKDSVYNFNSIKDFRNFIKGGQLWNMAQPLFKPILNNPQINGISKLTFVSAKTSTAATVAFSLTHGTFSFKTRDEGTNANGALTGDVLTGGYGGLIVSSPNTGYYRLQIWHGSYKGIDPLNNAPYDGITAANSKPVLVLESPDMRTIGNIVAWMQTDKTFNQGFVYVTSNVPATTTTTTTTASPTTTTTTTSTSTSTTTTTTTAIPLGIIVSGDVTGDYVLAAGATESYSDSDFDAALNAVKDVDNTFFLALGYGDSNNSGYKSYANQQIFNFITSGDSKYEKFMIVGAGYNKADYKTTTYDAVQYYNNDHVIVVHGGAKRASRNVSGFTLYHQLYKAANVLGRLCGLEPQVSSTFKSLDFDGEIHILDDNEIDYALTNGILVSYKDEDLGAIVILQGINSLQNNEFLVNEDNTSFSIQIKRIDAQLNKEIMIAAKKKFFGNQTGGGNRNTISPADVKEFTEDELSSKVASDVRGDNLILGYRNIVTTQGQDNTTTTYDFAVNSEINKMLWIGTKVEI